MPDDLVDRITRERKQKQEAEKDREQRAAKRAATIETKSDPLWLGIIQEAHRLIEKFNSTFPETQVGFAERGGSPPQGFDVRRAASPIINGAVWRNSKNLIEFTMERIENGLSRPKDGAGRIDILADDDGNIYMYTAGRRLATPEEVADYLLSLVLQ